MIITHHGDIMYFTCEVCGCKFHEAVSKTPLKSCGVWNSEREDHGTWMTCPDCGEKVLGFRPKKEK